MKFEDGTDVQNEFRLESGYDLRQLRAIHDEYEIMFSDPIIKSYLKTKYFLKMRYIFRIVLEQLIALKEGYKDEKEVSKNGEASNRSS
jgi:hypothetical protein